MKHTIYALFDPRRPEAIRYVGVTKNSPRRRLTQHVTAARRGKRDLYVYRWIRVVLGDGFRPSIVVVEIVDDCQRTDRERFWISFHLSSGSRLTNCTDGGEALSSLSPEGRARIVAANLGRKHSPEVRQKISQATKGKPKIRTQPRKPKPPLPGVACGERSGSAKLTASHVRAMRAEAPHYSHSQLAQMYGVRKCQVVNILRGRDWKDPDYEPELPRSPRRGEKIVSAKLTWVQVRAMRAEPQPQPLGVLADKYGVSKSSISLILRNLHWKEQD